MERARHMKRKRSIWDSLGYAIHDLLLAVVGGTVGSALALVFVLPPVQSFTFVVFVLVLDSLMLWAYHWFNPAEK